MPKEKKNKYTKWSDIKAKMSPERRAAIEANTQTELLEMNLRALRELLGKTQQEVAALAEMTQGELSKLERRDNILMSTLRRMVQALGGEVEVRAVFDDKTIRLSV